MVLGPASKLQVLRHLDDTDVRILGFRLMLFHTVYPNVNVTIGLLDWVLSQLNIIFLTFLPLQFCVILAKTFLILSSSHLEWFSIVI
jgi:hypothetical protein